MKIYVVIEQWGSPYEPPRYSSHDVYGVYSTFEKAHEKFQKICDESFNWIKDATSVNETDDWDDYIIENNYAYMCVNEHWCEIFIDEFELQ